MGTRLGNRIRKVVNRNPREKPDGKRNPHRKKAAKQLKRSKFRLGFFFGFSLGLWKKPLINDDNVPPIPKLIFQK